MRLNELIQDIGQLDHLLSRFELKFGVKSPEFYRAITNGELDEFDALDDYRQEFVEWLGLCKARLSLETQYRELIERQPIAIQIKTAMAV